MSADILIVDDEKDIRKLMSGLLEDEGYTTREAKNADMAFNAIRERQPSLVFLDIWLQGSRLDGMQILDIIKQENPMLPVIMISGHGTIDTAVSALKKGAYDFIEKPFNIDRLLLTAERALETQALKRKVSDLEHKSTDGDTIIGSSSAVNQLKQMIERIAPTNSRVMIHGPSGSGKELAARLIHQKSLRSNAPFVVLSAAMITPDIMDIELFGTEGQPGQPRKIGALEEAHGGTLYIEEIAEMPSDTQTRIMRVLLDQNFTRVGGTTRVHVDVRIISSTGQNIDELVSQGRFRSDLYHRLAVVPLAIPPLAKRREDIPELMHFFMEQISSKTGLPQRHISDDAMAILQSHDWPGNIRQLRNNVERLMILSHDERHDNEISSDLLPAEIGNNLPKMTTSGSENFMNMPLREAREVFERDYLKAQISRFGGNISKTSEFIGMERSALHRKLKALNIG